MATTRRAPRPVVASDAWIRGVARGVARRFRPSTTRGAENPTARSSSAGRRGAAAGTSRPSTTAHCRVAVVVVGGMLARAGAAEARRARGAITVRIFAWRGFAARDARGAWHAAARASQASGATCAVPHQPPSWVPREAARPMPLTPDQRDEEERKRRLQRVRRVDGPIAGCVRAHAAPPPGLARGAVCPGVGRLVWRCASAWPSS